jgi:hypothetical protein
VAAVLEPSSPSSSAAPAGAPTTFAPAKLYNREHVRVHLSTEKRDFFERNVYTIRAGRGCASGLIVDRPESFVAGSFADSA